MFFLIFFIHVHFSPSGSNWESLYKNLVSSFLFPSHYLLITLHIFGLVQGTFSRKVPIFGNTTHGKVYGSSILKTALCCILPFWGRQLNFPCILKTHFLHISIIYVIQCFIFSLVFILFFFLYGVIKNIETRLIVSYQNCDTVNEWKYGC